MVGAWSAETQATRGHLAKLADDLTMTTRFGRW